MLVSAHRTHLLMTQFVVLLAAVLGGEVPQVLSQGDVVSTLAEPAALKASGAQSSVLMEAVQAAPETHLSDTSSHAEVAPSDPLQGDADTTIYAAKTERPFPPTAPAAYGWWFLIFYMFYVMAIVCDEYLVPAVDLICEKFDIPEDVAGATLMAFACNGPELLTNTCAIFITHSSVGMGTIVGSAIFNVLVIVGCCPIAAPGGSLVIPKVSFLRDSCFSAVSIAILWWALPVIDRLRGSVLFGMAFLYVLVVAKSKAWFGEESALEDLEEKLLQTEAPPPADEASTESNGAAGKKSTKRGSILRRASISHGAHEFRYIPEGRAGSVLNAEEEEAMMCGNSLHRRSSSPAQSDTTSHKLMRRSSTGKIDDFTHKAEDILFEFMDAKAAIDRRVSLAFDHPLTIEEEEIINHEPGHHFFHLPKFEEGESLSRKVTTWICFILAVPTTLVLYFTIPDIKHEAKRHLYIPAFALSMIWLSSTAFVVCIGSSSIHYYWGIPQSFLGLTLAAIGTSFPNMWASLVTARANRGAIAVSNALGSNVQNVFLVLALPIWVYVMIHGKYVMGGDDIMSSVLWMGVTLAAVVVTVLISKFSLSARSGWAFMVVYLIYLVQATLNP